MKAQSRNMIVLVAVILMVLLLIILTRVFSKL